MILLSLIPPTTLISTPVFFLSYSATSAWNSFSSVPALQPTHTVSFVASATDADVPACAVPLVKPPAAAASRASAATRTTVVVRRFIGPS